MDSLYYVFHIYWPVFFVTCSLLYFTMYILIYKFTTKILWPMRFFLYPSNAAMMISISMAFATQARKIYNNQSIALLSDGFCKYIGPNFCLHCYNLWTTFGITSCMINLHMLYYRTMCLKHLDPKKAERWTLMYSLHYLFPIAFQILMLIPPSNHMEVHSETLQFHPDYDYTPYLGFGGYSLAQKEYVEKTAMFLLVATFYYPIVGSYWKHQAMTMLKTHLSSNTSKVTRVMFQTLIKGLNFQILLPMISYIPTTSIYLFNKVTGEQFFLSQYIITFLGTLPCLLDPVVQIYFITPYREAVRKFFDGKPRQVETTNVSWASRVVT
ncbi:Serpentine Receptor, class D (Delta) [Caenorhabditis elegans]|uniref:Serpentine Receptor, class D (Delta) n=1 Tax=Caenorhabditis elegans TaxID=6239 RepID=O44811_CAEEL|nr:Serpentine Receptor, class D (Delta) [Caenorhabditis elegans]CCD72176.1 Serpentine Receptor, class D (Delta) [Caenorhabditis elegans]|eukprot:NP_497542.1 Serpentine Receptor, class D (delta) [Caenorhabditis elegans]